jgi:FKBP-type peptidyl-prolyl cis-trans isomerase FklB
MVMRIFSGVILVSSLFAAPIFAADEAQLKTDKDKVNYSIGVHLSNVLKQQGVEFNPELVLKGFSDGLKGNELLVSEDELNRSIKQYQRAVRQKQTGKSKHNPAADNLKVGEKFLAENLGKSGVVATKSGLQYRILTAGKGATPGINDTVEFNFKEMLLNGKEIASTARNGKPETVKMGGDLLPALKEALLLMKAGSKWELYVPASLAYGEDGKGFEIPSNSALIYEVELLSVK